MAKEVNYQKLSAELDSILEQLQAGDIDIDRAIKLHARGQEIVKSLSDYLKTTENKITKARQKQK